MKKALLIFLAIFFCLSLVALTNLAKADFTITTNLTTNTVCPSSTIVIEDIVKATTSGAFTVTIGGSASSFATTVPPGFWLDQGSQEVIYSYITPSSKITPGSYVLEVTVAQGGIVKTVRHNIVVENCHYTTLKVDPVSQKICACEQKTISLTVSNLGNYVENYVLSVEGPASNWINLSSKEITLQANKSTTITASILTPCDVTGKYEANFVVKSKSEYGQANAKANIEVVSCYDYSISSERTFYSICEAEKLAVPIEIKNFGTQNNIYKINMRGPNWTNIDLKQLNVATDSKGTFNLVAQPPYKTQGNFTVFLEVMSEYGKVLKKHEISLQVSKCYDVAVTIEEEKDKMCNALSNTYSVIVRNTGKFQNTYDIILEAPEWVTISEKHLTLNSSKEKALTLDVHPPYNTPTKTYIIRVKAKDIVSKVEAYDELNITTLSLNECYEPAISTKDDVVTVAKDNTATALFIVENKGSNDANYTIEISGTATKFSQINPGTVILKSGKAQTLYLYIAPPLDAVADEYTITVTVRLKDTTVLASKTITVKVVEVGEAAQQPSITPITNITEITKPEEEEKEAKPSFFSKIWSWFTDLFKAKPSNETTTGKVITNITNLTPTSTINKTTKTTNQAPKLIKNISDITLEPGEKITINLAQYFSDPENDSLTYVTVKPLNISVTIVNSVVTLEAQQNFTGTREISFYASDGYNLAQSNIVKIKVSTQTQSTSTISTTNNTTNMSTKNTTGNESTSATASEIVSETKPVDKRYVGWIIVAAIVILVIILSLTGVSKKILNSFEEEKQEKPKKRNKKK